MVKSPWKTTHFKHELTLAPFIYDTPDPATALETTQTGTPIYSVTIGTDIQRPTFDQPVYNYELEAVLLVGVHNPDTVTRSYGWSMDINETEVNAGGTTTVNAGNYETTQFKFVDLDDGDVLKCHVWDVDSAGLVMYGNAAQTTPNRILYNKEGIALNMEFKDIDYASSIKDIPGWLTSLSGRFHCMRSGDTNLAYDGNDALYSPKMWDFKDGEWTWENYYSYYNGRNNSISVRETSGLFIPYADYGDLPFTVEYDMIDSSIPLTAVSTQKEHVYNNDDVLLEEAVTNVALPTSKPGTPQVSYTVDSADYPSYTPPLDSITPIVKLYAGIDNTLNESVTIQCDVHVDGQLEDSGSISTSNRYITAGCNVLDPGDGIDVEIYVWTDTGTPTYVTRGIGIVPSRCRPVTNEYIYDVELTGMVGSPAFAGIGYVATSYARYYQWRLSGMDGHWRNTSADVIFHSTYLGDTDWLIRQYYGDKDGASPDAWVQASSGYYIPYCRGTYVPGNIKYKILEVNKGD